jgi:hypothetical protein
MITRGTGLGKTEAFLLTVIDGIIRRKRHGVRGLQPVLRYPMNALANDSPYLGLFSTSSLIFSWMLSVEPAPVFTT